MQKRVYGEAAKGAKKFMKNSEFQYIRQASKRIILSRQRIQGRDHLADGFVPVADI